MLLWFERFRSGNYPECFSGCRRIRFPFGTSGFTGHEVKKMRRWFYPPPDVEVSRIRIGKVPVLIVTPKERRQNPPGILWFHGGGYLTGFKEMVYAGRAVSLVRRHGAVVFSPGYRLSWLNPYPAALDDGYQVLLYMKKNAESLGFRRDQIMVGGESAGGGLAVAACLLARDRGEVNIAFQIPLYPMISCRDTESSRNNHGRVWNTRGNHFAWWLYLRGRKPEEVGKYASPSLETDYRGLPPCYTFVGSGEPFYCETKEYVQRLRKAGVRADLDVYETDMHAFDMLRPKDAVSCQAVSRFDEQIDEAVHLCFAQNDD